MILVGRNAAPSSPLAVFPLHSLSPHPSPPLLCYCRVLFLEFIVGCSVRHIALLMPPLFPEHFSEKMGVIASEAML